VRAVCGGPPRMRILAIETATPVASVAIVDGSGVLAEAMLRSPMRHLEGLLATTDGLLGGLGVGPAAIEGLAVSCGPGGFTGLRIGIATAAARANARSIPVLRVDTLQALACVPGAERLARGERTAPGMLLPVYGRRPVAWPRQETSGNRGNPP